MSKDIELLGTVRSSQKWQQFLEEVGQQWPILRSDLATVRNVSELKAVLGRATELSRERAEREVQLMLARFDEKVNRAA
jgi:hypothetical protein